MKEWIPEAEKAIRSITYNITGSNARVNNNSIDNSTNVVNINSDVAEHISMLRQEIQQLTVSQTEKTEAIEIVNAIEEQFQSGSPSKAVLKALTAVLPHAGNIASIGSFLLTAIGG